MEKIIIEYAQISDVPTLMYLKGWFIARFDKNKKVTLNDLREALNSLKKGK